MKAPVVSSLLALSLAGSSLAAPASGDSLKPERRDMAASHALNRREQDGPDAPLAESGGEHMEAATAMHEKRQPEKGEAAAGDWWGPPYYDGGFWDDEYAQRQAASKRSLAGKAEQGTLDKRQPGQDDSKASNWWPGPYDGDGPWGYGYGYAKKPASKRSVAGSAGQSDGNSGDWFWPDPYYGNGPWGGLGYAEKPANKRSLAKRQPEGSDGNTGDWFWPDPHHGYGPGFGYGYAEKPANKRSLDKRQPEDSSDGTAGDWWGPGPVPYYGDGPWGGYGYAEKPANKRSLDKRQPGNSEGNAGDWWPGDGPYDGYGPWGYGNGYAEKMENKRGLDKRQPGESWRPYPYEREGVVPDLVDDLLGNGGFAKKPNKRGLAADQAQQGTLDKRQPGESWRPYPYDREGLVPDVVDDLLGNGGFAKKPIKRGIDAQQGTSAGAWRGWRGGPGYPIWDGDDEGLVPGLLDDLLRKRAEQGSAMEKRQPAGNDEKGEALVKRDNADLLETDESTEMLQEAARAKYALTEAIKGVSSKLIGLHLSRRKAMTKRDPPVDASKMSTEIGNELGVAVHGFIDTVGRYLSMDGNKLSGSVIGDAVMKMIDSSASNTKSGGAAAAGDQDAETASKADATAAQASDQDRTGGSLPKH